MSTPDVASIRKEILVNIEDPIQNRSLLDPDVDGNEETVDAAMARRLIHYMIKMDYIDENDALTEKFYEVLIFIVPR